MIILFLSQLLIQLLNRPEISPLMPDEAEISNLHGWEEQRSCTKKLGLCYVSFVFEGRISNLHAISILIKIVYKLGGFHQI